MYTNVRSYTVHHIYNNYMVQCFPIERLYNDGLELHTWTKVTQRTVDKNKILIIFIESRKGFSQI